MFWERLGKECDAIRFKMHDCEARECFPLIGENTSEDTEKAKKQFKAIL